MFNKNLQPQEIDECWRTHSLQKSVEAKLKSAVIRETTCSSSSKLVRQDGPYDEREKWAKRKVTGFPLF